MTVHLSRDSEPHGQIGRWREISVLSPGFSSFLLTTLLLLIFSIDAARAHFNLNLNIRVLHIEHLPDGIDVYLRLPMPYLLADKLGPEQADGNPAPAPYTTNAMVAGELQHYVDFAAVANDPLGLGEIAAAGHEITVAQQVLGATVVQQRVHTGESQPPFSTLQEAKSAFTRPAIDKDQPAPYVGDCVVDVQLRYRHQGGIHRYSLSSSLDPGLAGQEETANLILDYAGDNTRILRITGLMVEPVTVSRSVWKAAATFVREGIQHILAGYDHVLFVVCLLLGAPLLVSLAWRITGFTIGHSITLTLGFFGYTPSAPWFIPLVEAGIAASIIYAAIVALSATEGARQGAGGIIMTTLIGMLHGLGFAFVLLEILGVSSPHLWVSLLSFNVGVELGQLGIVLLLWPALYLVGKRLPTWVVPLRWLIALPCILLASLWLGQRTMGLVAAL